jgi:hypothetical protein
VCSVGFLNIEKNVLTIRHTNSDIIAKLTLKHVARSPNQELAHTTTNFEPRRAAPYDNSSAYLYQTGEGSAVSDWSVVPSDLATGK